jgi:hypothetical protein
VRPASHRSVVPQKTRVAPIQALARPHGVSPFRKELTPDQQFGQTRRTWMDQHSHVFDRKQERNSAAQVCDSVITI